MTDTHDHRRALERYSQTAAAQLARTGSARLAGLTAAAGAGLAMTGVADASVIYSGVQNLGLTFADLNIPASFRGTLLDIDGGGNDLAVSGWFQVIHSGPTWGTSTGGWGFGRATQHVGIMAFGQSTRPWSASTFVSGSPISIASHSWSISVNFQVRDHWKNSSSGVDSGTSSFNGGRWAAGDTRIAGFRLQSGNYGWIRIALGEDLGINNPTGPGGGLRDLADSLTIVDWAYDDSGAPIAAGDTGLSVPAPTPLALLAAGAAGIAATRRRRAPRATA